MKQSLFSLLLTFLFHVCLPAQIATNQLIQSDINQTLSMPAFFSDNMVLQQNTQAAIWGWATAGTTITVHGSWGESATTITATSGKWITKIQTPIALPGQAPAYILTVNDGTHSLTLTNVMVGEVWLCSGQSNMMYRLDPKWPDYAAEVAAANYPNIRFFLMPRTTSTTPLDNCVASWESCTPTNVKVFSPAAYFFGRELYNHPAVNVPIGLIQNACGQSSIQAWMKKSVLAADSELTNLYLNNYYSNPYQTATNIYNAMMAPLFPFAIKGTIWYQGEANISNGTTYTKANIALINDWRADMGNDFSFYAAQVAPYFWTTGQTKDLSARTGYFREAQNGITSLLKTGIIVTTDILGDSSELFEIHPYDKRTVGQRFAYLALAKDYGQNIQYSGPVYLSHIVEGSSVRVTFDVSSLGSGLTTKDGMSAKCFKLAGADKIFYPALAILKENEIVLSSPYVTIPVAIRYAFSEGAMTNLMNKEGIAAFPFRTDTWTSATYADMAEPSIPNPTAVNDVSVQNVCVYPNPVSDVLHIYGIGNDICQYNLLDLTGRTLISQTVPESSIVSVDVSGLNVGTYFLRILQMKGNLNNLKIVKE